jgi:hypothetical protein
MLSASELEKALEELRGFIHRLSPPLNQRPALFLEQKDALDRFVLDLQKRMGFRASSPTSFSAPQRDHRGAAVRLNGRVIPIERRRLEPRC